MINYSADDLEELHHLLVDNGAHSANAIFGIVQNNTEDILRYTNKEVCETLEFNFADRLICEHISGITDRSYADIKHAMYEAPVEELPLLINEPVLGPIATFRLRNNKF